MIPLFNARIPTHAEKSVASVLASEYIGAGSPVVVEFQEALAEYLDVDPQRVVLTNSCTAALTLALEVSEVRGSYVATTPMTFIATTAAIKHAQATPVWIDVEEQSCQMSARSAGERVQTGVSALLAVAWAGWLPDLSALRDVARQAGIPFILDAAQTFGAGDFHLHDWADFVCYSFGPTKALTCGDGGAVICPDVRTADWIRRQTWYGMTRSHGLPNATEQEIRDLGFKCEMNALAAALGLAGFLGLDSALFRARDNACRYDESLFCKSLLLRSWGGEPNPYFYTLMVDDPSKFIAYMRDRDIEAGRPHRRNDCYAFNSVWPLRYEVPNVDFADAHYAAIPVGWWLSDDDVTCIIKAVLAYPGDRR